MKHLIVLIGKDEKGKLRYAKKLSRNNNEFDDISYFDEYDGE